MNTLPAPGSRCGSSANVNWTKLAQHRKSGELSRKELTDPFWIWPGRKLWGQEHEPGSRETQAALSFILSGLVRRLVLLYRMPNLASAHTDAWKTGTRLGAGLAGVGVAAPCRPIAALQSQPLKVQIFHQNYSTPTRDFPPFPLPYSCFVLWGRHLHCAAGDLPLPSGLIFITGVCPELLYPALVLLEEERKAHWKWVAAQAVSPGGQWGGCWFQPLHPCALHASLRKTEIFQTFQRD